jgi:hypothetical protein
MTSRSTSETMGYDKGKEQENTWNSRLVEALHARGFASARFEPHYEAIIDGKRTPRKPDVDFKDGGTHLVSGKFGEAKESEALTSAFEYQIHLRGPIGDLAEVFAVVYPAAKTEKFRLHVLPTAQRQGEIPFACDTLGQLADRILAVIQGRIAEFEREPLFVVAPRLLLNGAKVLAEGLRGVPDDALESVFGGHDFFVSVLEHRLKGSTRSEALRMGGAYLFTNQLLFYILLSRAAELSPDSKQRKTYPRIKLEHASNPTTLSEEYFEKVRDINYEPIYGFDVAQYLSGDGAREATRNLVGALQVMAPNLDNSDLVGQLFQTLIPPEIRKPLGANFTNPRAARLLARLAIHDPHVQVLDPACGSGTLLVASYQRKKALSGDEDPSSLHSRFVEHDITGMDAMAFSAHLAVVNLASQLPLTETEHVRIATTDSTIRAPNQTIPAAQDALPHEFLQATLLDDFHEKKGKKKRLRGAVSSSRKKETTIELHSVNLVIMNPPFTYWGNMSPSYRENMKRRFVNERPVYRDIIVRKTSQQIFFFLLAERFLKSGGTVAAVTPLTTFTGRAFQMFTDWFCKNYTFRYIIVGLGRSSYSENTSLTECLVVAEKKPPTKGSKFRIIGTRTDPDTWSDDDIERIAQAAEGGEGESLATVLEVVQEELLPGRRTLAGLFLSLVPNYERARLALSTVLGRSKATIGTMAQYYEARGTEVHRYVLGSEHLTGPNSYGSKALLACRSESRAVKEIDRLLVDRWDDDDVRLLDRNSGHTYEVPPANVQPALRRFSFLPTINATKETDLCIVRNSPALETIMEAIYGKKEARQYLTNIAETGKNWKGGRWSSRVAFGSSQLLFAYRMNFGSPGTTVLAVFTEKPTFLAGGGYFVKGISDQREAKFLALWFNSTLALHRILESITITQGTWAQYEIFQIARLPVPMFWTFPESAWETVETAFATVSRVPLPSLTQQLAADHPARSVIDDTMLLLLGVPKDERPAIGRLLRLGCFEALRMLHATMNHKQVESETEEEEDSDHEG